MSSPLDIARDEWPALRWRKGRHPWSNLVGIGWHGGRRVKVIVWYDGFAQAESVRAYGSGTRSALRELRRRLA